VKVNLLASSTCHEPVVLEHLFRRNGTEIRIRGENRHPIYDED